MKKLILTGFITIFLAGCSLIPKNVEFFQSKVKAFPEPTAKQEEVQREAAARAKQATAQALIAATAEQSSTNVLAPVKDAVVLTDAVSQSLGPPVNPSIAPAPDLSADLLSRVASLNKKVDSFAKANEAVEGKKIEGTGLFQVPYFLWVGLIALVVFAGWHIVKMLLTAASVANPGAAVAVGGMTVASSVVAKGFHQLVSGGQEFKAWLEKEISDPALKAKITTAFNAAQASGQDTEVQNLVNSVKNS